MIEVTILTPSGLLALPTPSLAYARAIVAECTISRIVARTWLVRRGGTYTLLETVRRGDPTAPAIGPSPHAPLSTIIPAVDLPDTSEFRGW